MADQLGITAQAAYGQPIHRPQVVIVKDIDMSIGAMCRFMIKWAIAAIPAAIILGFVFLFLGILFGGILGGLSHGMFK